jgi:hypothetical protein
MPEKFLPQAVCERSKSDSCEVTLYLFEYFNRDDKKRGTFFAGWQGSQFSTDQFQCGLEAFIPHTEEKCHHPAPQESACGCHARDPIFLGGERLRESIRVMVFDNKNDHFHEAHSTLELFETFNR